MQTARQHTTDELHHRDRSLAGSLERLHGIRLEEKPKPGNAQMSWVATAVKPSVNQPAAILALTEALKPAGIAEITDAMARMQANTGTPYGVDEDLLIDEWRSFFRTYPADVALTAIAEWPNTNTAWPKRAEIKPILDALASKRRAFLVAVQAMNATETEAERFPKPTPEEIEAGRRGLAKTLAQLKSTTAQLTGASRSGGTRGLVKQRLEEAAAAEQRQREAESAQRIDAITGGA